MAFGSFDRYVVIGDHGHEPCFLFTLPLHEALYVVVEHILHCRRDLFSVEIMFSLTGVLILIVCLVLSSIQ